MFVPTPNPQELRQGDIVKGFYYPQIKGNEQHFIGSPVDPFDDFIPPQAPPNLSPITDPDADRDFRWLTSHVNVLLRCYSMILSQCCELELQNGRVRADAFVLAPVLRIPKHIASDPEKLTKLKQNSMEVYVGRFYVQPCPPLSHEYVVNFSRVFSVSSKEFALLLSRKVLELTPEARVRMKLKLGYHFSRSTEDERAAGLME